LSRLVEDLLDVTAIQAGRLVLRPESVDVCELVRHVTSHYFGPSSMLRLAAPKSVMAHWDRNRIEQVVLALLSNAVKYGRERPIEIEVGVEQGTARLSVRDSGIGIAEDEQSKIFERFARAASVRNYSGLGLGLYIARKIVEAHRGSIGVRSKLGEGSTFVVEIPLEPRISEVSSPSSDARVRSPLSRPDIDRSRAAT
jgi:signal transduction histidine kinase